MKLKAIPVLAAFMLIVLAGCNNAPPNQDEPQPFSFSESNQSAPESETPAGKESKEVETTPEAVQEVTTETDTVSSEQPQTVSETGQAAQPAEQSDKADKTEHSVSTPQPDIPKESETPAPPETEETTSETETDFDIDYWISFAKGYAQSVGLLLDSEAIYCWDNPIRAGAHCKYLARDIHSRLDRYKADEEITAVWIWAEEVSDGIYDIYIGYA
ncbi:hypothetical protein CE91St36_18180 [Christensenellaceae bacterium]|nr:hypothetical protein CE91St36_18180 [Christensenellaceae bacterium]BDF61669.1 hypothetical protein CE91St37_18190 [Christensenellaceae bacterium]